MFDLFLPQHTGLKYIGHYKDSEEADDKLIIIIRCVGERKHLKHALMSGSNVNCDIRGSSIVLQTYKWEITTC